MPMPKGTLKMMDSLVMAMGYENSTWTVRMSRRHAASRFRLGMPDVFISVIMPERVYSDSMSCFRFVLEVYL